MKMLFARFIISVIIAYFLGYGLIVLKNVWVKELDLHKTFPNPFGWVQFKKEFVIPEVSYGFLNLQEKYKQGLDVYGLKWEQDFLVYKFTFSNKNKKTFIEDVRIRLEFPGGFVKEQISNISGIENVTTSSQNDFFRKVNSQTGEAVETLPYYSNVFTINIGKANPDSHISYNLILKEAIGESKGRFTIEYSYFDPNKNEKSKKEIINPIKITDKKNWVIDKKTEVKGTHTATMSFIPVRPMTFKKNGKVNFDKPTTSQSSEPEAPANEK